MCSSKVKAGHAVRMLIEAVMVPQSITIVYLYTSTSHILPILGVAVMQDGLCSVQSPCLPVLV